MREYRRVEVKDKAGKFVSLSNEKINTMNKEDKYAGIFHRGIK